jgi:diadenosine tetraphosphate (Ap4A) HIT family hydrolase
VVAPTASVPGCPLCEAREAHILWQDEHCRVVLAGEPRYPAFCRVIWRRHVAEMTDLADADRQRLLTVVFAVERALRDLLHPDKINLASLGNQVPHLHWHVIPRHADDAHFPDAIWAPVRRPGRAHPVEEGPLALRLRELLG